MKPAQHKRKASLIFSGGPEAKSLRFSSGYHKVEREILSLLLDEEYQKLKAMLSSYSGEAKKDFFERRGTSILYHVVVNSNDTEALKIIMENISTPIVQELLKHNDFEILKSLLRIQYFLETYTMPGQTEEEVIQKTALCYEKLRLLSVIDPKLLSDFLKGHQKEDYMSESIVEMIKSAIVIPKVETPIFGRACE